MFITIVLTPKLKFYIQWNPRNKSWKLSNIKHKSHLMPLKQSSEKKILHLVFMEKQLALTFCGVL